MLGLYVVCLFTVMMLIWTLPIGSWLFVVALVIVSLLCLGWGGRDRL